MPILAAASSTSPSVTATAIGWPTARYWRMTFLFWNTTRRLGAIVRTIVRSAGEVDDLIGLDAGGARIDRVGADAGEIVDFESSDDAFLGDADLAFDAVIAGMNVGDEAFDAVGDELDRPLEQLGQRHRRHLVGISVHLDAERAADILGQHVHLSGGEAEIAWKTGSASCAAPACLDRPSRRCSPSFQSATMARASVVTPVWRPQTKVASTMASEPAKALSTSPTSSLRSKREIVAEAFVDHRRCGRRARFPASVTAGSSSYDDVDQFAGVLGLGARARHYGADRFALPAGAIDRDRILRRRLEALEMGQYTDPGRHHLGEFTRR